MEKKYQVFISSTYTDMKEERQAAVTAILEAGHIPAGMELFAASNKQQMDVIKRWIDSSDIFMLILGGRYGSVEPESGKSYTQLEYEYAVTRGKPFFALYLTEAAIRLKVSGSLGADAIERNESSKLNEFRKLVLDRMCSPIEDTKDIRIQTGNSIRELAATNKLGGWVRAKSVVDAASNESAEPKIEIVTGQHAPYCTEDYFSGQHSSVVRVGIRNTGSKTLSNCKVYIERIHPSLNNASLTFLIDGSGFHLRQDDPEKLIDIAQHWQNSDKFKFSTPPSGGFFDSSVYMEDLVKRTFSLKVTATECERVAEFEIFADKSKKLHLKFLEYVN
ncbi:DUF4062 domain-containing protein [Paraburkholderia fungorum]|uniref:DUF4062 domain-containing protein n=1 Tax=Paraburkholderia fungorum TaxID=134537 RepID=A0AAW3UZH2_9BURK|nr:DUF4062 domain-containing protein [Paraburkholderia fungorum]MBB4515831.1 hypothetical protein [Paraburkholderia fungorum]MBB6203753.1 hypothetical protein [Paraburkholderia fungorum]